MPYVQSNVTYVSIEISGLVLISSTLVNSHFCTNMCGYVHSVLNIICSRIFRLLRLHSKNCVFMLEVTQNNKSSCGSCINHCEVISFFPALSSSQLTYIDGAQSDTNIVRQFNVSSEIGGRTADDDMTTTITLLTKVRCGQS